MKTFLRLFAFFSFSLYAMGCTKQGIQPDRMETQLFPTETKDRPVVIHQDIAIQSLQGRQVANKLELTFKIKNKLNLRYGWAKPTFKLNGFDVDFKVTPTLDNLSSLTLLPNQTITVVASAEIESSWINRLILVEVNVDGPHVDGGHFDYHDVFNSDNKASFYITLTPIWKDPTKGN